MPQQMVKQNRKFVLRKPRLFTFLVTIGFSLVSGVGGILFSLFLFNYFIPLWNHIDIDVEGRNFSEIALVDFYSTANYELSQDNVILKTVDGEYFSYHQNQWQQTELPEVDLTKFPYNRSSCKEWAGSPPTIYLRRTRDSSGIEFDHAIGANSRCYILLEDGSLQLWTRDFSILDYLYLGLICLCFGIIIGGITGNTVARRKIYNASELKIL